MALGIVAAAVYGLLAIVGGAIGYAQAQSVVSLWSGLVSGILLILGSWLWSRGVSGGTGLAIGVTVALIIVFIRRWQTTRKAMPAALMIFAGLVALICMILSLAG